MFPNDLFATAAQLISAFADEKKKIVTAESCTGGLLGALLTSISGASEVMERGFITYSNDAKIDMLGVLPELLQDRGAVSAEVAEAMASGALEYSHADVAVAITGIAGPGGGTAAKPVGLVYIGIATREGAVFHVQNQFKGDRDSIRLQAVRETLSILVSVITGSEL